MYGFTKSINLTIFSSLIIGVLALSYFKTENQTAYPEDFNDEQYCAHDHLLQKAIADDPDVRARMQSQDAEVRNVLAANQQTETIVAEVTLPVAVHVIHENGTENIDDAQVEQAIQDLNDAFENVGFYEGESGVNTEIAFCLAKTNPDGEPSTGITRRVSELTDVTIETEDLELKALDRWNPNDYINIWVVRSASSDALVTTVRGYSYLPAFHGTDRDGLVIESQFMGESQESSTILAHVMGHYLGLYHTFHNGCGNDDCTMDGDQVCDTPPDWTTADAPCEVDENSCYTDADDTSANNPFTEDGNDLRDNYMDITPLGCYSAFTQGQADRMMAFINGARSSLLLSTVCDNDCDSPIEALSFAPGNDTTVVINSGQVLFASTSTNATTFNWTVNGQIEGAATGANYVYNPDSAGVFTITLTAGNADADCAISRSIQVTVIDCFGNTHVDDATGVDVFMCGQPNSPCKTIQFAVDNSVCSGDTIFIHSGTYSLGGGVAITTPVVQIPEDYTVTFFGVEDNGDVIIDGGGLRRAFIYDYAGLACSPSMADNGTDLTQAINFANLTIQNGRSTEEACTDGTFLASGAAMHLVNADTSTLNVSIDNCRLFNNTSLDADLTNIGRSAYGAIYFNGGLPNDNLTGSSLVVTDSEFSGNRAEQIGNGGVGGAMTLVNVESIQISDSYFCDNSVFSAAADAGDLGFDRNAGGAIAIFDPSVAIPPGTHMHTIENSFFVNNSATTNSGIGFPDQSEGGAIFLGADLNDTDAFTTMTLNILNSSFYNNEIETGIEHFENTSGTITESGNILEDLPFAFSLGNDTTICNIDSITFGTTLLGSDYAWNTGDSTAMLTVGDTGTFILTISMGMCSYTDTIVISEIVCGEICGNGIDDNGDGLIDCFDPQCCGMLGCDENFYNECANDCEFSNNESDVQAEIKWQSNVQASMSATPITADIDGDGTPEVIVPRRSLTNNRLSILNGLTGEEKFEVILPAQAIPGNLAVADVDKDGTAEIFYFSGTTLRRIEHDGTISATSLPIAGSAAGWVETVGIADFNEDGEPEVYLNNVILNSTDLTTLVSLPITTADAVASVAADVLPNFEGLELVMGKRVFRVNITTGTATVAVESNLDNGIVALADIDKDGDLDGVVSVYNPSNPTGSPSLVYGWDLQTNATLGQYTPVGKASPSTVADIDGDGQLEIVFRTATDIIALERDFTEKWTTLSASANANTASPVTFDFDGDGDFEIVTKGTEALEILDGTNGNILFTVPTFSATQNETPVIVDVDGDGLTEILISDAASQNAANNDNGFIRAFTSSTFPWQSTRKVWNQNAYFNVNIHDDLSIPIVQQQHHIVGNDVVLNNFLAQHGEQLGADASFASVDVLCALNDLIVTLEVCNTGDNELSHTTPITFYRANPTAGSTTALDTEELGVIIPIDSCATVEFTIPAQYDDPVFIVINDDNSTNTPFNLATEFPNTNIGECDYTNNMINFTEVPEPYELDLGGGMFVCDNSSVVLNASSHFVSYEWQDGTTDSTFSAFDGGRYWVTVIDSCGGVQSDTVQLTIDPVTINVTEPMNAVVCPTQDTSFTVIGNFDTFKWLPDTFLDCDTCQTVNVIDPDEETQYVVTASNSLTGCYSIDTVILSFTTISTSGDTIVCPGTEVLIHGNSETAPGQYVETFTSVLGCDSTSTITLVNFDPLGLNFTSESSCPNGSTGTASVFVSNGVATNYSWSVSGVGNSPTANNLPAGTYTVTVTDGNTCTTEGSVTVGEQNLPIATAFISPTCVGDSDGELEIVTVEPGYTYSVNGSPFQANPIFTGLAAGDYPVAIQDGECTYTGTGTVSEDPDAISVSLNPNNGTINFPDPGDSIQINASVNVDIATISWTNADDLSCTDCLNPMVFSTTDGTYTVTVTDENGCTSSATYSLTITADCVPDRIEVPNAFTPDGDGINDTFSAVVVEGIEKVYSLRIYNRWGNQVFSSEDGSEAWDGMDGDKAAPMDVYVYVITVGCEIGTEEQFTRSGDVTLIR